MIDYENDNDRTIVINRALYNGLGTKEEIELYEQLSISLELIKGDFNIIYSDINDGINFGITTPYPNGLPDAVGILFYDIDFNFNVKIKEIVNINDDIDFISNINPPERYFTVIIKKE